MYGYRSWITAFSSLLSLGTLFVLILCPLFDRPSSVWDTCSAACRDTLCATINASSMARRVNPPRIELNDGGPALMSPRAVRPASLQDGYFEDPYAQQGENDALNIVCNLLSLVRQMLIFRIGRIWTAMTLIAMALLVNHQYTALTLDIKRTLVILPSQIRILLGGQAIRPLIARRAMHRPIVHLKKMKMSLSSDTC